MIFAYVQDQILHVLSIALVTFLWQRFGWASFTTVDHPMVVYAAGFVLVTQFWFVTERVLSYNHSAYQQWVEETMWPRMMSRATLYSLVIVGFNVWTVAVIAAAILVGWNDLEANKRNRTIGLDMAGVVILIALTLRVTG